MADVTVSPQISGKRSRRENPSARFLGRVLSSWQGRVGAIILGTVLFGAIFAPWISPAPYDQINFNAIMQPPSPANLLGTDEVGRDIFSRVIYGARSSLMVAIFATLFSALAGGGIGLFAAWIGGWTEKLIMRLMDAILAFPLIVLALTVIAVMGASLQNAIFAIGLVKLPHFARIMRAEVLSIKDLDYVRAAITLGASPLRLLLRHVLPNAIGPVLVYISIAASQALMTEASLSFLGLGVQPPTPSWGGMVSIGMQNFQYWWMSFFPGLAIFVTVLGFNFFGDAVRDAADARLH